MPASHQTDFLTRSLPSWYFEQNCSLKLLYFLRRRQRRPEFTTRDGKKGFGKRAKTASAQAVQKNVLCFTWCAHVDAFTFSVKIKWRHVFVSKILRNNMSVPIAATAHALCQLRLTPRCTSFTWTTLRLRHKCQPMVAKYATIFLSLSATSAAASTTFSSSEFAPHWRGREENKPAASKQQTPGLI